ncbi:nicotinate-nicotinamide nucleotide adenylyltransferase, partial [Ferroacidibacillus organovorans]
ELTRDGVSYTIDTLREVRRQVPYQDAHIYLLLGADMLAQFGAWRESAAIADGATLLAAPREGYELSDLITRTRAQFPNVDIRQLPMPPLDVSATWLRSRIKEGRRVEWLLPAPVLEYVEKRGLYR